MNMSTIKTIYTKWYIFTHKNAEALCINNNTKSIFLHI